MNHAKPRHLPSLHTTSFPGHFTCGRREIALELGGRLWLWLHEFIITSAIEYFDKTQNYRDSVN